MAIQMNHRVDPTSNSTILEVIVPAMEEAVIQQILDNVPREIARIYVERNYDAIAARIDLTGLANLAAMYVAKQIAEFQAGKSPTEK